MVFPCTCTLMSFPELMGKRWQLIQSWVSSSFILPKLWQLWMTFAVELLFVVGITVFQSNTFPCRHFFIKVLSKSAPLTGMLHSQELYTCDNGIYLVCRNREMFETSAIGQMLRCVYFVVYNCIVCHCSLNKVGYV